MSNAKLALALGAALLLASAVTCQLRHRVLPVGVPELASVERAPAAGAQPWLIALHGLGDSPENFMQAVRSMDDEAHLSVLRAPGQWRGMRSWFPMEGPRSTARAVERAARRVAAYAQAHQDDARHCGKPVVTGFSQGGILSFALAALHAEHFSAAAPVAGRLYAPLLDQVSPPEGFPVRALHGSADERIAAQAGAQAAAALERAGADVQFQVVEGARHSLRGELGQRWFEQVRQLLADSCR